MKDLRVRRSLPAIALTALASLPAGHALAAKDPAGHLKAPPAALKAKKYVGPFVDMRWGPVRAAILVKGKKILKVGITTSPENFRSQFIDQQATPLLRQETLKAQSANIDTISGATMTSEAYIMSLQKALKKAHLK